MSRVQRIARFAVFAAVVLCARPGTASADFQFSLTFQESGFAAETFNFGANDGGFYYTGPNGVKSITVGTPINALTGQPTPFTYGDFNVFLQSSETNNPGSSLIGSLNLSSVTVTNTAQAKKTLSITAVSSGFTAPASPVSTHAQADGFFQHDPTAPFDAANNSISAWALFNSTNVLNYGPSAVENIGQVTASGGPFSYSGNYSLTAGLQLTVGAGHTLQNAHVEVDAVTPAPGGIALIASVLPAFAVGSWLRRRRSLALVLA